ncbi:MAG: DUF3037 domain-containing protein [Gemmatimonadota bacterium]|jgi:hypothetical protein|nr:DUF3037 domain-containing protein [Gemmatimonadota bacterium]
MTERPKWVEYHFTVLRAVPHVYRGEFVNIGVVVLSRTADFLGMRAISDLATLRAAVPAADTEILLQYLQCFREICEGNPAAGEIALLSRPERFHWLSSPRSDLLQASPVHEGIGTDMEGVVDELFRSLVRGG